MLKRPATHQYLISYTPRAGAEQGDTKPGFNIKKKGKNLRSTKYLIKMQSKMKGLVLTLWMTIIVATSAINPNPPEGFDHSIYLDTEKNYRLFWKFDTETITFEVSEPKKVLQINLPSLSEFFSYQQND